MIGDDYQLLIYYSNNEDDTNSEKNGTRTDQYYAFILKNWVFQFRNLSL